MNLKFNPDEFIVENGKVTLRLSADEHNGLAFNPQGKLAFVYNQGSGNNFAYSNIPGNGISGTQGNVIRYVGANSSVARKKSFPLPTDPSYPIHAVDGVNLNDVVDNILADVEEGD